jgi:hypothetical protein
MNRLLLDPRVVASAVNARLVPGPVVKEPADPLFIEERPWKVRSDNLYTSSVHEWEDGSLAARVAPAGPGGYAMRNRLRAGCAAALVWAVGTSVHATSTWTGAAGERQLFLDDRVVESSFGLRRTLHPPTKRGLIKDADGRDWERGDVFVGIEASHAVARDRQGRFHMTYRYLWWDPGVRDLHPSIGQDKAVWFRVSTGYASSADGIHWHKPKLGRENGPTGFVRQAEFPYEVPAGVSKENNLGCPLLYVRDLQATGGIRDPARRFLVRAGRREDTHNFAPIEWQPLSYAADWPDFVGNPEWSAKLTPIPGGQFSPRGQLVGYDAAARLWFTVGQSRFGTWRERGGRDISRCTSPDLVHWTEPELVLPVAGDEAKERTDWVEYMEMVAYRAGDAWLGQLVIFHGDRSNPQYQMPGDYNVWRKGTTEIRLVVSRDAGKTWQRVAGQEAWLSGSTERHGYDRLVYPGLPVEVGDEVWFYYPAFDGDHLVFNRDGTVFEPGFLRTGRTALATLRKDGYVSLDAGDEPGTLLTRPLPFTGGQLAVNLCAPRGSLLAELMDETGRVLAESTAVTGDGVALPVYWKKQAGLIGQEARTVRLRFRLHQAAFYGFNIGGGAPRE